VSSLSGQRFKRNIAPLLACRFRVAVRASPSKGWEPSADRNTTQNARRVSETLSHCFNARYVAMTVRALKMPTDRGVSGVGLESDKAGLAKKFSVTPFFVLSQKQKEIDRGNHLGNEGFASPSIRMPLTNDSKARSKASTGVHWIR
jgi:hypothetical protein